MSTNTNDPFKQLQLLEQDRDHLLFLLKGGGKRTKSIGLMAAFWNGIVVFMGVSILPGTIGTLFKPQRVPAQNELMPLLFLSVFLLVGLGLIYTWVYLRFGKTLLIVNPGFIGLQNELFGWKRVKTLTLGPEDRGVLSIAYTENDIPVHQIEFSNQAGKITFGTTLQRPVQERLLKQIHDFLGVSPVSGSSRSQVDPELLSFEGDLGQARSLLEESHLEIKEVLPEEWLIRISPRRCSPGSTGGIIALAVILAMWFAGTIYWSGIAANPSFSTILSAFPFLGIGFVLLGLMIFFLLGTIEIVLSRTDFNVCWSVFGIGRSKGCLTEEIRRFSIIRRPPSNSTRTTKYGSDQAGSPMLVAELKKGGNIPVQFSKENWTPALAFFLNAQMADWRRG